VCVQSGLIVGIVVVACVCVVYGTLCIYNGALVCIYAYAYAFVFRGNFFLCRETHETNNINNNLFATDCSVRSFRFVSFRLSHSEK